MEGKLLITDDSVFITWGNTENYGKNQVVIGFLIYFTENRHRFSCNSLVPKPYLGFWVKVKILYKSIYFFERILSFKA
ncbi:MAG: hypothetical protein DCC43_12415 [Candidatus Brocadia sp.]|nr:hypothetical protein [Candidatus Brocadia sp. AMX3]RIJ94174.1 MAG: hypothetical protein DCC43_12415 [Candidatus Brocadia sp.]